MNVNDETENRGVCFILCTSMMLIMTVLLFVHARITRPFALIPLFSAPVISMLLLESMSHDPFLMTLPIVLLNVVFFCIITALAFCISRRTSVAVLVCAVFALICGLAEHYVLLFRSVPLFPWDLASAGVAATVVGGYKFVVSSSLAASVTGFLFLIYFGFYFSAEVERLRNIVVRIASCVLSAALLFGYSYYLSLDRVFDDFGLLTALFVPKTVYERNGFIVSFMMTLRYLAIEKPSGYSEEALDAIADDIKEISPDYEPYSDVVHPNIIVVMNEAFSDLSVLCDFETNKDYIPFIRSLSEDTIRGNLHVSVLGGNTANTEFEFLTGLSMAYLPMGSIPYQQYIKSDRPTLASQLAAEGYSTLAVHPYLSTGWNRDTVYEWFGFDKLMFRSDIPSLTAVRNYVSDISVFRYILSELESKEQGKPLFTFNVTMQNHGGYATKYSNFIWNNVTVNGLEDKVSVSQYLSLLKRTDDAVRMLITRLQAFDEPTIVMFFGDHQPVSSVSDPILKEAGVTLDINDVNDLEKYYTVPFFLWANYDIREEEVGDISANYLSLLLCRVANIELTDSQIFLSELQKSYPVITANVYMDADGKLHPTDDKYSEEFLSKYSMLEYNYLFDSNTTGLFELYGTH